MDLNLLNIRKDLVLDITKKLDLDKTKAQVALALDFSGSMSSLFNNGTVKETLERILPIGLKFDDNGEIDFYLFHHGVIKEDAINTFNVSSIAEMVMRKHNMGTTNYAPVMSAIVNEYTANKTKTKLDLPVYVIFITDGNNDDKANTQGIMKEASHYGIFFQFVGIGSAEFPFLEKLDDLPGRKVDNANFFKVPDLKRTTDADLYTLLLTEFPTWLREVKFQGMIKN